MKSLCLILTLFAISIECSTLSFGASPHLPLTGKDLITGKTISTSGDQKLGVVVVFLSAACPCSNSHIPELNALYKDYPEFNFVAVHSNANESDELGQLYFKNAKLPFPIIQDDHSKLADEFKALKTPHAFVVLPTGEIVYQGGVSNSADFARADKRFLKDALQDIREHKTVRTSQGRTLGCVIKRG